MITIPFSKTHLFWIRNWCDIATHLAVLLLTVLVEELCTSKKPKPPPFQIESGWNLAGLFKKIYASIDGVGFSIWRHTFNLAAMTSFHAEKWYHLVSEHAVFARHILSSSVRQLSLALLSIQFLIHNTFVPVIKQINRFETHEPLPRSFQRLGYIGKRLPAPKNK